MIAKTIRCIHFTPGDGFGGVECAMRSWIAGEEATGGIEKYLLRFSQCVPLPENIPGKLLSFRVNSFENRLANLKNPVAHLWALMMLLQYKPDVLVCSLWGSLPASILYKVLCPRVKMVCFLHSAIAVRLVDKILNAIGMQIADAIWADSKMTLAARVPSYLQSRKSLRVISFILERVIPRKRPVNAPVFVFWGRLDYMKGIDRSLRFLAGIYQKRPDAALYLYGPDRGEAKNFQNLAHDLGISQNVHFMGTKPFDEIRTIASNYSYYLMLSRKEGMAMSVVEAMQLGLVPIVTPVGEIANYCRDGWNAVIVKDREQAISRVLSLLEDSATYRELQNNAMQHWTTMPSYRDDFSLAIKDLYGVQGDGERLA